jgi:hypothetical protein
MPGVFEVKQTRADRDCLEWIVINLKAYTHPP